MEQKTQSSFEEFEIFKSGEEKPLLKLLIITNLVFLLLSLILVFVSEEIFHLGALSWRHYWILFAHNLLTSGYALFSLIKKFKVGLTKYLLGVSSPLIISAWIYFINPKYATPLFFFLIISTNLVGLLFYDTKNFFVSNFVAMGCMSALLFHYFKTGTSFSVYEAALMYIIFFTTMLICFSILKRTRIFLNELLQKRNALEEAKIVLEIKVKARTRELEELTKSLDEKVKERTKELQERIDQLERFQKATIDRELRMVELKEEIEKLKKEKK